MSASSVSRKITTMVQLDEDQLRVLARVAAGAPDDAEVSFEPYEGATVKWTIEEVGELSITTAR